MIVGGAKQSFETTFRVLCYAGGSANALQPVPVCGGALAAVASLILNCIGLARALNRHLAGGGGDPFAAGGVLRGPGGSFAILLGSLAGTNWR